jgi:hypothetical protein
LTDRHPLEVGTDGIGLLLIERKAASADKVGTVIQHLGSAKLERVVLDLVVIPDGNPGEEAVGFLEVEIGTVAGIAAAVIVSVEVRPVLRRRQ